MWMLHKIHPPDRRQWLDSQRGFPHEPQLMTTTGDYDPDELARLEEQRAFLQRSLLVQGCQICRNAMRHKEP